jgi:ADP-ribosylglycohydrolase
LFRDGASKDTLANEQGNTTSTDFTAASRFPSLLLISKSESEFVDAAIAQSSVTHQHPSVKGATAFMAHSIWRIVQSGQPPSVVFPLVAKDLDSTYPETVALAHKGIAGVEKSPEQFSQVIYIYNHIII